MEMVPTEADSFCRLFRVHATNEWSLFDDFSIQLKNGATLTGIVHIPPSKNKKGWPARPLLVGIHGGTCSAHVYDITPQYTASLYSDLLDVPFIAFNRPNYQGSSGWVVDRSANDPLQPQFEAPEGSSYFEEEARWYHELVFPALWEEFAKPNGCTSLVTTSHSMGVPVTIITSNLYSAAQQEAGYVWAGMVITGFATDVTSGFLENATMRSKDDYDHPEPPFGQDSRVHAPPFLEKDKKDLMAGPPGLCDENLRHLIWKQNTPLLMGETVDLLSVWPQVSQQYRAAVKIPVLYGLGGYDWIWQGTKENAESFCKEFVSCPRIEWAVVKGAPHMIELSEAGIGWWIRVFGWAMEVDAGLQTERAKIPTYV